jgi:peptidoglycan/LPS O-acetylase OafA/YrhL
MRGIASTVVLFGHCLGFFLAPAWFEIVKKSPNGHGAFVFFFVLSGYVLALSLEHSELESRTIARFYIKRLFRIYPAVWAAVAFALLYIPWHYKIGHPYAAGWAVALYPHAQFNVAHVFGTAFAVVFFAIPPLGTIFTELAGSALIPALYGVAKRGIVPTSLLIIFLFIFSILVGEKTPHGVGIYFFDFMLGISLAVFRARFKEHITAMGVFAKCVAGVALFWLFFDQLIAPRSNYADPVFQAGEAIAASIVIVMVAYRVVDIPFLRSAPLRILGDISYSLYLIHVTVMAMIGAGMGYLGIAFGVPFNGAIWNFALGIVVFLITVPLSMLSYMIVEKNGIRAGDYVIMLLNLGRKKSQ